MQISKNYAIDFDILYKYRSFKDGISFCEGEINLNLFKGDHNPQFRINLTIFNIMIFDFCLYNVNHYDEEDDEDIS